MSWVTRFVAVAAVLGLASCAVLFGRTWRGAGDFMSDLRCGMTREEIGRILSDYRGAILASSSGSTWATDVARKGNTTVLIGVRGEGIELIGRTDIVRPQQLRVSQRSNICTGEKTVELTIAAPLAMAGASVVLDHAEVARIGRGGLGSIWVSLGARHVALRDATGSVLAETTLYLNESSSGTQRWKVAD